MTLIEILKIIVASIGLFALFQLYVSFLVAWLADKELKTGAMLSLGMIAWFGLKLGGMI